MPRNLDHRLEILAPVENALVQQRLSGVFDVLLQDNVQAWDLRLDGSWRRARPKKDEPRRGTHDVLMRKTVRRTRVASRPLTR
jgi:polyphosphate kinase